MNLPSHLIEEITSEGQSHLFGGSLPFTPIDTGIVADNGNNCTAINNKDTCDVINNGKNCSVINNADICSIINDKKVCQNNP